MPKIWKNYLILLVSLTITEGIFRILSKTNLFSYGFLRSFIALNVISLILSLLFSLLPKLGTKIFNFFIVIVCGIYAIFELAFYNYMGVYASLNVSSQAEAVTDYIKEFLESFRVNYFFMIIPLVILILYYIFIDKRIKDKTHQSKKKNLISYGSYLFLIVLLCISFACTLNLKFMQNKFQQISNKALFKSVSVPTTAIKEFGIITYAILDVKNFIFPYVENVTFENNNQNDNTNIVEPKYDREIDDTAWQQAILNETNKNYKTLNNYFINQNITNKNEYTGYFKDKNVIVIMMESINLIINNKEYFPNYAKMLENSWYFENNYSPRNSCSTGNNELSTLTGLYSIYNSCTSNVYRNNTYYNSLFNLFNNKGYVTTSMHDFTEGYYRRNTIHKNLGVGEYYGVQKLGIPYSAVYGVWASDEDFMKKALDILDKKENPQMTFLTTVSTHQPYTVSTKYGDLYYDLFANTNYHSTIKRYLSKVKVFDNALGILLNGLEESGKLDDTVILMYGDHYPYGISKKLLNTIMDFDNYEDYEAERTPLLIYNKNIEKKTFSQYTSFINILPTLANLFDLDYDPRLYMGNDLFSDEYESLVVFADGSWKNEIAYFDASNSKVKYYGDKKYTDEEVMNINNKIKNQLAMSSLAIKTNYFSHLGIMLEKYKVEEKAEIIEENDNTLTNND